ncbi:hypothetical protein [Candidatus Protochlamydia amoebophila]|nr:hypothetical protein [Candidatus Protochlamydia amoebophila]
MRSTLSGQLFPPNQRFVEKILVLPKQSYQIDVPIKNPSNVALLAIENDFFSFKTKAAQQIFSQIIASDFFAALRTKQQTGYLVLIQLKNSINTSLFFAVQSNTHDPQDLLFRFELFLEDFLTDMGQIALNQLNFEKIKNALLEKLNYPPQNLQDMGNLLKTLTFKYEGDFDRVTKGIQGFKELHYEDFLEIVMQLVGKDNKRRLAILVKETSAPKSLLFTSLKEKKLKERSTYNHLD